MTSASSSPENKNEKEDRLPITLDDEEDIAATRPFYKRRSLVAPQPYLTVSSEKRVSDGAAVIRVIGDLDLATILPFRDAAFTAIGLHPPLLLLDMSSLGRLDITGLNTLLTVGRVAQMVKVPVKVRASERLLSLLQTTGLIRQLPIEDEESKGSEEGSNV